MKPSKLKCHLESKHITYTKNDETFFKRHEACIKHQRLDATGSFHQENVAAIQTSHETALEIDQEKPETIWKTLVCKNMFVKNLFSEMQVRRKLD